MGYDFFAPLEPGPGRGAKIDNRPTGAKKKIKKPARITKFGPGLDRYTALSVKNLYLHVG